jgi:hypothetical protein
MTSNLVLSEWAVVKQTFGFDSDFDRYSSFEQSEVAENVMKMMEVLTSRSADMAVGPETEQEKAYVPELVLANR